MIDEDRGPPNSGSREVTAELWYQAGLGRYQLVPGYSFPWLVVAILSNSASFNFRAPSPVMCSAKEIVGADGSVTLDVPKASREDANF